MQILGITYALYTVIIFVAKSIHDLATKEFALPIAILFGINYIIDREFINLCVMFLYILFAIIDIYKIEEKEEE